MYTCKPFHCFNESWFVFQGHLKENLKQKVKGVVAGGEQISSEANAKEKLEDVALKYFRDRIEDPQPSAKRRRIWKIQTCENQFYELFRYFLWKTNQNLWYPHRILTRDSSLFNLLRHSLASQFVMMLKGKNELHHGIDKDFITDFPHWFSRKEPKREL